MFSKTQGNVADKAKLKNNKTNNGKDNYKTSEIGPLGLKNMMLYYLVKESALGEITQGVF